MIDIEQYLDQIEIKSENDYSLYKGKTGLSLCYFILYTLTSNVAYEVKAKNLMDELSENISDVESLQFSEGLAGIGWAIEWLAQNDYIDANTDEILEDLDDELYKTVVYAKSASLSLETGTIGRAMYFFRRRLARNPGRNRYLQICTDECLILLIDEIHDKFLDDDYGFLNKSNALSETELIDIAQSFLFLIKVYNKKINTEIIKQLIISIASFLEIFFSNTECEISSEGYSYLLYAYMKAGTELNDELWISRVNTLFAKSKLNISDTADLSARHRYLNALLSKRFDVENLQKPLNNCNNNIFDFLITLNFYFPKHKIAWEEGWIL